MEKVIFVIHTLGSFGPGMFGAYEDIETAKEIVKDLNYYCDDLNIKFIISPLRFFEKEN